MCKDVYVFAEQRDGNLQKVGIELIGEARKLADDLGQRRFFPEQSKIEIQEH